MKRRQLGVTFHPHALDRLRQRFPRLKKESIRSKLRYRIQGELRKGVQPDWDGAITVEVEQDRGVWAVCYPSLMGGWEVRTLYPERRRYDLEEQAMYGGNGDRRAKELRAAIDYFKEAIWEGDEIIDDCGDDLKAELMEQKEYFIIALEALRKEAKEA